MLMLPPALLPLADYAIFSLLAAHYAFISPMIAEITPLAH